MPRLYDLAFCRIWYIAEGPSRKVSFDLFVELNSSPQPDGTKPVWLAASRMHLDIMGQDYTMGDIRMHLLVARGDVVISSDSPGCWRAPPPGLQTRTQEQLILLDGLEYFVSNNGFEKVMCV
ncbi:MAG: hypothetical protein QXU73_07665 [Thermoplasmata archaeon]